MTPNQNRAAADETVSPRPGRARDQKKRKATGGVEDLYRKVADTAFDWEYWLDSQGNYVYLSPSCERVSGYSREEFLADPELLDRIVHPDDRTRFAQHVEAMHGSERRNEAEIELRIITRDGHERWLIHRCAPVNEPGGGYIGRRVSNVDTGRFKLAEERLLRLNRELMTVRDCARAALHAADERRLYPEVCRILCNVASFRMAWIGAVEHDEAKSVRPLAWSGVEDGYLSSASITWADTERGRGPTGTAARTGKSQAIQSYASDDSGRPWRERAYQRGYRSSAAIPLLGPDGVFAVLSVYGAQPHLFTSETLGLLEEIAADVAAGVLRLR